MTYSSFSEDVDTSASLNLSKWHKEKTAPAEEIGPWTRGIGVSMPDVRGGCCCANPKVKVSQGRSHDILACSDKILDSWIKFPQSKGNTGLWLVNVNEHTTSCNVYIIRSLLLYSSYLVRVVLYWERRYAVCQGTWKAFCGRKENIIISKMNIHRQGF